MPGQRPFSKLKKQIEALFAPELSMQVDCTVFRNRTLRSTLNVPRYTVKLGKEVIWDFPKDFPLKKETPHLWSEMVDIIALIRDYIDMPLDELTTGTFAKEHVHFIMQYLGRPEQEAYDFMLELTPLFIAADRRLGKEHLMVWARQWLQEHAVHKVLRVRFG